MYMVRLAVSMFEPSIFIFDSRYICAPETGHDASPYALSAVLAVCFPFFFYIRLYIPGPPMRILIFFVTAVLVSIILMGLTDAFNFSFLRQQVIGYSYQDQFQALPSSPGVGWEVAWVREIIIIFSFRHGHDIFSVLSSADSC